MTSLMLPVSYLIQQPEMSNFLNERHLLKVLVFHEVFPMSNGIGIDIFSGIQHESCYLYNFIHIIKI